MKYATFFKIFIGKYLLSLNQNQYNKSYYTNIDEDIRNIEYLKNDNLKDNLAFSFQMQKVLGEYYPGLTRKIYIKQYRYNMHLCKRTLLIELGDENNTLEEAKRSCYPIAHALDLVLNGKE